MDHTAITLITLGGLFAAGLGLDVLARRSGLPRVTLLLVFGLLLGPSAFDLLPELGETWRPMVTHMALVMVGFLLGGKLTLGTLRESGRRVLWISLSAVVVTAAILLVGLLLIGVPLEIAILLAALATATDPAATADVVHEARADGRFTRILLGVVAVDDAWGLVVFSLALAAVGALSGHGGTTEVLLASARELGGAVLIGPAAGLRGAARTRAGSGRRLGSGGLGWGSGDPTLDGAGVDASGGRSAGDGTRSRPALSGDGRGHPAGNDRSDDRLRGRRAHRDETGSPTRKGGPGCGRRVIPAGL